MKLVSYGMTDPGKKRSLNEDAMIDLGDRCLWIVADGMGGHDSGDVASRRIVEGFPDIPEIDTLSAYVDFIDERMIRINREIFLEFESKGLSGGSTVVGMLAHEQFGVVFWAGDSRLYQARAGRMRQVSEDHSYVEELVRTQMITPEEAEHHPDANVISRAVGAEEDLYLDFDFLEISPGDRYLLCSDGLYKELEDHEIQRVLNDAATPREAAERLVDGALNNEGRDNVSVIVIDVAHG